VLTSSTSEAYTLLFKVLCDPGDEVLVPRPSYPLFEHLARLDAVVAVPYDLEYHGRWSLDVDSVIRAWSTRTRALLAVHPNNPTGSFMSSDELAHIASMCAAHDAALVVDEVFADYELTPGAARNAGRVLDRTDVLTFSLGGLSKSAGLPQVKLGWIALAGPQEIVDKALARLEFACDAYLSVSTPVQVAAADLLSRGELVRRQIQSRISANHCSLIAMTKETDLCRTLHAEGGWYAIVQIPAIEPEEDFVLALLETDNVLVHPGYFFDFPRESYVVVSLLPAERTFSDGIEHLLRAVHVRAGGA
jgi:aspartate/methionine/tyrosine aminotransferase